MSQPPIPADESVRERYSRAASRAEAKLCCPVEYDRRYLEVIPREILERDYGCGDPSRYLRPGATVLDLGSGGGKICYIAAQIVGPQGRVIGIDINDEMHRVLKDSGRAVISDIVADRDVPGEMQSDAQLWSGCIAGAFREDRFLEAFARAGFGQTRLLKRDEKPWRVVRGIEFRSVTAEALKRGGG